MNSWELLKKELAYYGFKLINHGMCRYKKSDGQEIDISVADAIRLLEEEIKENAVIFSDLWDEVSDLLLEDNPDDMAIDEKSAKLFIFSVKDTLKLLHCFEGSENSEISNTIQYALERDINSFNRSQIKNMPDYKISLDWIHRLIHSLQYVQKLLKFSLFGEKKISQKSIKTAAGPSGPWSNLDLPVLERVWPWEDEDENFRKEDRNKRKQRRYNKGLANYNNDGRVGEGHYWRELRNEPYSWYDRSSDGIYPGRNVLTRY